MLNGRQARRRLLPPALSKTLLMARRPIPYLERPDVDGQLHRAGGDPFGGDRVLQLLLRGRLAGRKARHRGLRAVGQLHGCGGGLHQAVVHRGGEVVGDAYRRAAEAGRQGGGQREPAAVGAAAPWRGFSSCGLGASTRMFLARSWQALALQLGIKPAAQTVP